MLFSRRQTFLLALLAVPGPAPAFIKLGDDEWMRRFKLFVKAFNDFINDLNDNKLDPGKWKQMQTAWDDLKIG